MWQNLRFLRASDTRRRATAVLAVGLLWAAVAPAVTGPELVGLPLSRALDVLREEGLPLVFTTALVRPEMVVESAPGEGDPRAMLDEILAPHGLQARDGRDGRLIITRVVAGKERQVIYLRGVVLSDDDARPLAGARIRAAGSPTETVSGDEGRFALADPGTRPLRVEARRSGYLPRQELAPAAGSGQELVLRLTPAPIIEEELEVTTSRLSLLRQDPLAPLDLGRDEILSLPHLGDDFFRALTLLPGTASNDVTAQFHVRGGRRDETQILLDGQELYEVFHLKDFDSALSVIAPVVLESADLTTGGFSAQYGDRMAGVLEMTTVQPKGKASGRVGVALANYHAGGWGAFDNGRGAWFTEARRGSIDLVGQLLGDEDPNYWDAIGKLEYRFSPRNSLRLNLLASGDDLTFNQTIGAEEKRLATDYSSSYGWITHQAIVGRDILLESAISRARIDRDRRGFELEEDVEFTLEDVRDLEVLGFRQAWSWQIAARHAFEWGYNLRRFDTRYDYLLDADFDNPLADIRSLPDDEPNVFNERFEERHDSGYVGHLARISEPLTVQLGLRYDRHTQTDESLASPRLNFAYAPGTDIVWRIAWGRFSQSQRPYELQVEDGEEGFHRVERSEHRVVGFERLIGSSKARPLALRIEGYQRLVEHPRPRYENLFEPINTFPEVEPDRIRIAPGSSRAQGLEIFLRGHPGPKFGWWVNYTWVETEDRIDGRDVPRKFDQTHSLNVDFDLHLGQHWKLNLAWRYRTGWPTTPLDFIEIEDDEGELQLVPQLGALYSRRLPDYHRLDLRASRRWTLKRGLLTLFIDVQNLYDRGNVAGFDVALDAEDGLTIAVEEWAGVLPSAGVSFEF